MATKERVKTYKVLRDGMRIGYSVRNFGDFMPEAKSLPTLRTLLNTDQIEEVWVDADEFAEWEKDQAKRDKALQESVDEDGETDSQPKKKVAKKTVKKTAAKKTVKKGKTSGRKLAEQRV